MAYPFLKAKGHSVGNSLCSDEDGPCKKNFRDAFKNCIVLPSDHVASKTFGGAPVDASRQISKENLLVLISGPSTLVNYQDYLATAKTVLWNAYGSV